MYMLLQYLQKTSPSTISTWAHAASFALGAIVKMQKKLFLQVQKRKKIENSQCNLDSRKNYNLAFQVFFEKKKKKTDFNSQLKSSNYFFSFKLKSVFFIFLKKYLKC